MKKFGIALVTGALLFSGCALLDKKEDEGGQGEQQGGGAAAPEMKPNTQYMKAYGPVPGATAEGLAVGMSITVEQKAGPTTSTYTVALVGEDGDMWKMESGQMTTAYKGYLIGQTVSKKDGTIQSAMVGKKGAKTEKLAVENAKTPAAQGGSGEKPATEDVKIALGTFKAYKNAAGGTTTWVGAEGDMQGVLLKMESAQGGKELKEKPAMVELDLGGTKVKAKKMVWDNGDVMVMSDHPAVKGLNGGIVEMTTKGSSMKVTAVATDAKPQLEWGK